MAAATAPTSVQLSQSRVIGQAGFAYLGGLRMAAAGPALPAARSAVPSVLTDKKIQDRVDLLPSIRIIQMLNPQLEQPYYYVSFILALKGRMADALGLAKQGVENNPTSGLLRANYVQLMMMQDRKRNLPEMLAQTKVGLGNSVTYTSLDDQYESYGIFRTTYLLAETRRWSRRSKPSRSDLRLPGPRAAATRLGIRRVINSWGELGAIAGVTPQIERKTRSI